eukprot:5966916-Pyramimonas_sp.AAC.1
MLFHGCYTATTTALQWQRTTTVLRCSCIRESCLYSASATIAIVPHYATIVYYYFYGATTEEL